MDGPFSQVGNLFFRLQCVHVRHVRMWEQQGSRFSFYCSERLNITAVSSIGVTRKHKGKNTKTVQYMNKS